MISSNAFKRFWLKAVDLRVEKNCAKCYLFLRFFYADNRVIDQVLMRSFIFLCLLQGSLQ